MSRGIGLYIIFFQWGLLVLRLFLICIDAKYFSLISRPVRQIRSWSNWILHKDSNFLMWRCLTLEFASCLAWMSCWYISLYYLIDDVDGGDFWKGSIFLSQGRRSTYRVRWRNLEVYLLFPLGWCSISLFSGGSLKGIIFLIESTNWNIIIHSNM